MDRINKQEQKIKIIYVVGLGRSGSTIIGAIFGSAPEVVNVGELTLFNKHKNLDCKVFKFEKNICTCGKEANECPFWSKVESKLNKGLTIFSRISFINRLKIYLKILLPFYHFSKVNNKVDDYFLMKVILEEAKKQDSSVNYILDSSKSLERLIYLMRHPCFDINVLFLTRDGRGYVNSRLRKKTVNKRFWGSMRSWIVRNSLIVRYLKKEKIPYYHLSYDKFCMQPDKHIKNLNQFFGVNIHDNYIWGLKNTESHVRAGNPVGLDYKNFKGLNHDDKWKTELPRLKRIIATCLLYYFNKIWVFK